MEIDSLIISPDKVINKKEITVDLIVIVVPKIKEVIQETKKLADKNMIQKLFQVLMEILKQDGDKEIDPQEYPIIITYQIQINYLSKKKYKEYLINQFKQ